MKLVDDIKNALQLEVRAASGGHDYFEAVFMACDLAKLTGILEESLGQPLKPAGKNVRFAKDVQKIVDLIGGLRKEQSFYAKGESENEYICAALWPWQSDPARITLKIGMYDIKKI